MRNEPNLPTLLPIAYCLLPVFHKTNPNVEAKGENDRKIIDNIVSALSYHRQEKKVLIFFLENFTYYFKIFIQNSFLSYQATYAIK